MRMSSRKIVYATYTLFFALFTRHNSITIIRVLAYVLSVYCFAGYEYPLERKYALFFGVNK